MITDDRQRETLSALIDREDVDADALARVLDEPGGRALLVDFVRLRQAIAHQFDAEVDTSVTAQTPAPALAPRSPRRWRMLTAAALALAAAGGGFWLGERRDRADAPPVPTRVVEFKPGVDWQSMPMR